jgi:hypothetical protein
MSNAVLQQESVCVLEQFVDVRLTRSTSSVRRYK